MMQRITQVRQWQVILVHIYLHHTLYLVPVDMQSMASFIWTQYSLTGVFEIILFLQRGMTMFLG